MSSISPLFRRILVATDESAAGAVSEEVGRRIVEREGGNLLLVRVEAKRAPLDEVLADTAYLRQESEEIVESGHSAYYRVEYGEPSDSIALVAAEEEASLIVLAHRHRGLLDGMRHPSVSTHVASGAPVPLLIWPEDLPAETYDSLLSLPNSVVLVPLDGSAEAERALPLAVEFAKRHGRMLLLAHVLVPASLGMAGVGAYIPPETIEIEEQEAREYMSATRKRLTEESGLVVQTLLLAGSAAQEIGRALLGHDGSVIIMTTHGRKGLGKVFFGSVASAMIEQTHTPLIIIPPMAVDPARESAATNAQTAGATHG